MDQDRERIKAREEFIRDFCPEWVQRLAHRIPGGFICIAQHYTLRVMIEPCPCGKPTCAGWTARNYAVDEGRA